MLTQDNHMRLIIFILLCLSIHAYASSQETAETAELRVSLISSCDTVAKNTTFSAGVFFDLKPDWHLYWINPGDTGLAPKILWRTPTHLVASEIQWPYPRSMELDGINNLGYSNQLLLPVTMQTKDFNEDQIDIAAEVSWLVCKDICIPGKAELKKKISVGNTCLVSPHANRFSDWREKIPEALELMDGSVSLNDKKIQLEVYLKKPIFRNANSVEIFIENPQVVSYQPTQTLGWKNNWVSWTQEPNDAFVKLPSELHAVIVVNHQRSYRIKLSTTEEKPL
jgi:DsbC/DsbD-like thiol-disulfide interchange protein